MYTSVCKRELEVIAVLEQLPMNEYVVLYNKYIQGKRYREICDEIDRSYSCVTTLHGRALNHLQEIINEKSG